MKTGTIAAGIAAISAAGAGGAAVVVGGFTPWHSREAAPEINGDGVCILADVSLVEGMAPGCLDSNSLTALKASRVLDRNKDPVVVALAHPENDTDTDVVASTCAEYETAKNEGRYPVSSREMRREAYFTRACGVLAYLAAGASPQVSHFAAGRLSRDDVVSLAEGPPFKFVEAATLDSGEATVSGADDGGWRIAYGEQFAVITEIAHADFNGDGVGDILATAAIGVEAGTAFAGDIGLIEKSSLEGPVTFTANAASAGSLY